MMSFPHDKQVALLTGWETLSQRGRAHLQAYWDSIPDDQWWALWALDMDQRHDKTHPRKSSLGTPCAGLAHSWAQRIASLPNVDVATAVGENAHSTMALRWEQTLGLTGGLRVGTYDPVALGVGVKRLWDMFGPRQQPLRRCVVNLAAILATTAHAAKKPTHDKMAAVFAALWNAVDPATQAHMAEAAARKGGITLIIPHVQDLQDQKAIGTMASLMIGHGGRHAHRRAILNTLLPKMNDHENLKTLSLVLSYYGSEASVLPGAFVGLAERYNPHVDSPLGSRPVPMRAVEDNVPDDELMVFLNQPATATLNAQALLRGVISTDRQCPTLSRRVVDMLSAAEINEAMRMHADIGTTALKQVGAACWLLDDLDPAKSQELIGLMRVWCTEVGPWVQRSDEKALRALELDRNAPTRAAKMM